MHYTKWDLGGIPLDTLPDTPVVARPVALRSKVSRPSFVATPPW
jgi:hypothetical protein